MNSKRIGNIGEAKTLSKFVELGIPVYIPFGDNETADLVAEFNNKLNKIQVKTSKEAKDGIMFFNLTSSTAHRKQGSKHIYTAEEVDYFACYNIERDALFLVPFEKASNSSIVIRYAATKNSQKSKVNLETEYLFEKILNIK